MSGNNPESWPDFQFRPQVLLWGARPNDQPLTLRRKSVRNRCSIEGNDPAFSLSLTVHGDQGERFLDKRPEGLNQSVSTTFGRNRAAATGLPGDGISESHSASLRQSSWVGANSASLSQVHYHSRHCVRCRGWRRSHSLPKATPPR